MTSMPVDPRYTLLNKTQLAAALGKDRKFVTAMCRWGHSPFQFALGGCTTLDDALTWLRATPQFPGINRQPTPFNHRKTTRRVKQAAVQ